MNETQKQDLGEGERDVKVKQKHRGRRKGRAVHYDCVTLQVLKNDASLSPVIGVHSLIPDCLHQRNERSRSKGCAAD